MPASRSRPTNPPSQTDPLLIDSTTLAGWLSTSKTTLFRRLALGQVLKPHCQFGQQPRWLASEVREWILAGMPDQRTWEAMRKSKAK